MGDRGHHSYTLVIGCHFHLDSFFITSAHRGNPGPSCLIPSSLCPSYKIHKAKTSQEVHEYMRTDISLTYIIY